MNLRLGAATLNQTPLDWEGNMGRIRSAIQEAKKQDIDLLCLQELTITSYGCQDMFFASWMVEKAEHLLLELVPETRGITVAVGLPHDFEGKLYNCMALLSEGQILGISAKQNLPGDGVYYEARWFEPWKAGEQATIKINGSELPFGEVFYDVAGKKIAFEICEDAWRGEKRPACRYVGMDVDIVLNPSASHFEFGKTAYRQELVRSSSEKFNCTYVFANQCGNEAGRLIYEGDMLIARKGEILAINENWFSFKDVQLVAADLDGPVVGGVVNLDKNKELLGAASIALFDYARKSRSSGFTISLSGGADSSLCAVLVAEMVKRGVEELGVDQFLEKLGKSELKGLNLDQLVGELLTCVYQGTTNSTDITRNAAREVAKELGAAFFEWTIDKEIDLAVDKIESSLGRTLNWEKDDLSLQNIQARMRSPLIWMMANVKNHLLITTSNRSEGDVGYATMDGDTSGGLAPLADLDKPFIRRWLGWAQAELGYPSLALVNEQQPTAELRPGVQTDEGDLMSYELLLEIEKLAIHQKRSPSEILLQLKGRASDEDLVQNIGKFFRMWAISQWKRERIAPSFHFDHFSIDPKSWLRFPILNSGFQTEIDELLKND